MRDDVKEEWLTALRSGDYLQGKGILRRRDGSFCCLGVLCEIAVKDGVIEPSAFNANLGVMTYDDEASLLPHKVMNWAGLNQINPSYRDEELGYRTLATLNDASNYSFAQIADVIEEHF